MNEDEDQTESECASREEWLARREGEERVRLQDALGSSDTGYRGIVCKLSTGWYRNAIINGSKGKKRRFRPGVNEGKQLAEEFQLRAMLEYANLNNRVSFGEYVPMAEEFQRMSGVKVVQPTDPKLFKFLRYLDLKTSKCPKDELLQILMVMERLGIALFITHVTKLIFESEGRPRVRSGRERDILHFVCYLAAIKVVLRILKDHPDRSEELIGATFREPFRFPRIGEWIRISGIPRESFYRYWNLVQNTALNEAEYYFDWAMKILPTAFTEDRKNVGTLSKSESDLLSSVRNQ